MKPMTLILAALALLTQAAPAPAQTPTDVIVQTRVEKRTLDWLIEKTRLILDNARFDDLLSGEVVPNNNPTFSLDEITKDPQAFEFRDTLSQIFKRDLKGAILRLRIPKVYYQIEKLAVAPKSLNVADPTLNLKIQAEIHGLQARLTEGLQADIMIPDSKMELQSFVTASVDPVSLQVPSSIEPMGLDVEFDTVRDQGFKFNLKGFDTSRLQPFVERHKNELQILSSATMQPIGVDQIKVTPVVARLNHLQRSVTMEEFKPILQRSMNRFVGKVLSILGKSLQNKLGPRILASVFSNKTRSDMMITGNSIQTKYSTAAFQQPVRDQLLLGIRGDLCTSKLFAEFHDDCYAQMTPMDPIRDIPPEDRQKGLDDITRQLAQNKMDLVISMTEEYINRLLKATIDADLWDDRLDEDHLALGPKGVFAVFNQRTQTPEMFIDLMYFGDGSVQRILINDEHPIRFPLRMSTSLSFLVKDGIPHMLIKTEKLLSDQDEVINGIPEYDLDSKLVRLFKKKIAKTIVRTAAKLEGQIAIDLDFPVLKGVGLENTTYEASPYGRLNWYFKL